MSEWHVGLEGVLYDYNVGYYSQSWSQTIRKYEMNDGASEYHARVAMILVRSSSPLTLLPRRSPSIFRSQTWYAGVFFFGIHGLCPPSCARSFRTTERSTTFGDDVYLMTSRYSSLDSAVRVRKEIGVLGSSESESDVSDPPDGTNGGVGSRLTWRGNTGKASISRRRSCPLRY